MNLGQTVTPTDQWEERNANIR